MAESQDSVLPNWKFFLIVWGVISGIKLGFLLVFPNLNPSLKPRQKKANKFLVTLTRCKLGPVSSAWHAINVPDPARPGSTTFETKECYCAPYEGGFPLSDNFYVRTYVNYECVSKIETMY